MSEPLQPDSCDEPTLPPGPGGAEPDGSPVIVARPVGVPPPAGAPQPAARPPSVLRIVLLVFAAVALGIVGQIILASTIATSMHMDEAAATEFLASPVGFIVMLLPTQGAFAFLGLLAVSASAGPARQQTGLLRTGLSFSAYVAIWLGGVFCAIVGEVLGSLIPIQLIDAEGLRTQMTWTSGLAFVLVIALVPGFVEELFFRGYILRRLLQRWRPWKAIALTTVLFALAHIDPKHIVFAAGLGVWVGIVAWRIGSVWPTIFCHVGINALWNIYSVISIKLDPPEHVVIVSLCLVVVSALLGFIAGINLLVAPPRAERCPPGDRPIGVCDAREIAGTDKHPDL